MSRYVLRVDCQDEKGLIRRVTDLLYRYSLNVEDQEEFVQEETQHFFLRTEFTGDVAAAELEREAAAILPAQSRISLSAKVKKRIVVMASSEPYCLGDLLLRAEFGELNGDIAAVISNHESLRGLVERFQVPFRFVPHEGKSREQHEDELQAVIEECGPDYVVLAKYMRVLGPALVGRFPQKMVNIHHSFLPAFAGARPYHQAFERGVKVIGATAHFVTADLDGGPIIAQDVLPVDHSLSAEKMRAAGRDVEKQVLARAVRLVLDDRVFVHGRRTIVFS
jgi:formyltetrahydrofolate deformylase